MNEIQWLYEHQAYFSREMNGYSQVPIGPYLSTLPLIDRAGKILDIGAGNGMLLKFLISFAPYCLEPYGVEIKEAVIQQAQTLLPDYAGNFFLSSAVQYDFKAGPFDIIITNPFYAFPHIEGFIEQCLCHLTARGRIIFRIHDDVLRHYQVKDLKTDSHFKKYDLSLSRGCGLMIAVIDQ